MKTKHILLMASSLIAASVLSSKVAAHDRWILPNEFNVSAEGSKGVWITSDVTAGNQVFVFDKPFGSEDIEIITPKGKKAYPSSSYRGSRKSVFDYQLTETGTYRFQKETSAKYYSRYKMKGSDKPVRTRVDKLATKAMMPKGAYDLEGALYFSRVETYVTLNTPNDAAFKPTNQYLELLPITHPADIVEKNDTEFKLLFNGKPVKNAEVSIVREGTLYRNQIEAIEVKSDNKGIVSFIPQEAGRYLLHATYEKELKDNALADKMVNTLFLTFEAGLE